MRWNCIVAGCLAMKATRCRSAGIVWFKLTKGMNQACMQMQGCLCKKAVTCRHISTTIYAFALSKIMSQAEGNVSESQLASDYRHF